MVNMVNRQYHLLMLDLGCPIPSDRKFSASLGNQFEHCVSFLLHECEVVLAADSRKDYDSVCPRHAPSIRGVRRPPLYFFFSLSLSPSAWQLFACQDLAFQSLLMATGCSWASSMCMAHLVQSVLIAP